MEIIILEIKYQVLSGEGFLQSAPLSGLFEKSLFLGFYLASLVSLYWLVSIIYRKLAGKVGQMPARAAFTAGMLFLTGYGLALLAFFQLHRYLADHVEMSLLKEIAGGNLKTAIAYVSHELIFFIAPVLLALVLFLVFYFRIKPDVACQDRRFKRPLFFLAVFSLAFIAVETGASHALKYNLGRSVGYGFLQTVAHQLTDIDGDGSSILTEPRDAAPFDSTIFWGAVDLPANGLDENGLGGDLPHADEAIKITESFQLDRNYRHLVIIVSESTRADLIGKEVEGRLVAPNLTRMASSGSSISRAYSHAGFTASSLYTLFSGRYTYRVNALSVFDEAKLAGMGISVISGQDERWGRLDRLLGTRRHADFFYDPQVDPGKRVFASRLPSSIKLAEADLVEVFKRRLQVTDWDTRQLFYLNFQAGHFPYYHNKMPLRFVDKGIPRGEITAANKDWLRRTYWNAMSYMDEGVGKVIASLKAAGVWEDTLLLFLGDHGESLFHDGSLGHGQTINNDQLQIPMVLSAPGINFQAPIGLMDVAGWLRSIIHYPNRPLYKKGDCVLMYTGAFNKPSQLGNTCRGMKGMQVYTVSQKHFYSPSDSSNAARLALIHDWERAVYRMRH